MTTITELGLGHAKRSEVDPDLPRGVVTTRLQRIITNDSRCEGCNKLYKYPTRALSVFGGRILCRVCQRRKKMPLIGYEKKSKWISETNILNKKRNIPCITWPEQQIIWKEAMARGLTPLQAKAKINALKWAVRKNHWAFKQQQKPKTFTEEFRELKNGK